MIPTGHDAEYLTISSDSSALQFHRSGKWSIGMFAVCWLVALLWLVVRVAWLLNKPRSHLKEMLGIIEPVIPDVVVDRLGDTWASVYWSYANLSDPNAAAALPSAGVSSANSGANPLSPPNTKQKRPKIKQQVVRIGDKILVLPGDHRRLVVSDLAPDKSYKISVYPLYTHQKDPTAIPNVGKDLLAKKTLHIHTLESETDQILSLSEILVHQPPTIPEKYISHDEYSACAQEVRKIQLETFEACVQYADLESQYQIRQESLDQELVDLHAKRRQDESQRAQLRAENKALEDDDHALEVKVNKLKLQAAQAEKFRADSEQNLVKVVALNQAQLSEKVEFERQLHQLNSRSQRLQQREVDLQERIREISALLQSGNNADREIKGFLDKLRNTLSSSSDEKLALLNSEEAKVLGEDNRQRLIREIQLDARIDWEWARAQRMLEQQYVDAYLRNSQKRSPGAGHASHGPSPSRHNSVSSLPSVNPPTNIVAGTPGNPVSPPPAEMSNPSRTTPPKLTPTSSFISINSVPTPNRNGPHQLHQPSRSTSSIGSNPLVPSINQPTLNTPSLSSPGLATAPMNGFVGHHPYSSTSMLNAKPMNPQLMQSAMQSSNSQHLHPTSSFVSMNPQMPLTSLNRLPSASVTSLNPLPFDAFGINSGGINVGVPAVPAFAPNNGLPNAMLGANLGQNLGQNLSPGLGGSLFQTPIRRSNEFAERDGIFGSRRGHEARSSVDSFSATEFLYPRPPPTRDGHPEPRELSGATFTNSVPDPSPNPSSRRTTSLFFGSKSAATEPETCIESEPRRDPSNGSSTDTVVEEDGEHTEPTASRSPRRGMGSRFFHKSSHNNHRSGSFVRRLSIFSRKESEPAEPDEV